MKKTLKQRLTTLFLALVLAVVGLGQGAAVAEAATGLNMNGMTIRGYAYTNSNFSVYNQTGSGKKKIGTCYGSSDLIRISGIGSDGWSCITYPAGSKYKTGYCKTSYLFQNTDFSGSTGTVQSNTTTYKKSNCSTKYGTTTKGDTVFIVGSASGNTQILYPCSGYWKVAWVKGKYSISGGKFTKATTSYNPEGCLDSVTSNAVGKITVAGWAFDRDNLNSKLQIHVYVGGAAGSGAPCYEITANTYRSDVNKVYSGVGNYHGFSSTISVSKTGTQTVYVYAINTGGGSNVLIGSKTVTIKSSYTTYKGKMTASQLRNKFPNGKYWNHAGNPGSSSSVNNQNGYTSTPCSKHGTVGTSKQTCNGFAPNGTQLSWQCMGFAEKLGYDFTGYNPRSTAGGWKTSYASSSLNSLKPGDIVRFKNNGHSIFVTGVSGNTVTYADCNSDGHCKIRWGVTISKSTLKKTFTYVRIAPYQLQ